MCDVMLQALERMALAECPSENPSRQGWQDHSGAHLTPCPPVQNEGLHRGPLPPLPCDDQQGAQSSMQGICDTGPSGAANFPEHGGTMSSAEHASKSQILGCNPQYQREHPILRGSGGLIAKAWLCAEWNKQLWPDSSKLYNIPVLLGAFL